MLRVLTLTRLAALIGILSVTVLPSAAAPSATSPTLGTAVSFSVLAGSAVTNTGATSISGDVGISPGIGAPPHYTGFDTVTLGGVIHDADAIALGAQADNLIAYNDLASQACDTTYAGTKELAGENLVPGVYCATSFHLSSGTLTLSGSAGDVWIFKSASDVVVSGGGQVVFNGTASSCDVWWRAVSSATFDANSAFIGNILAQTSVTFAAGASLDGRAFAQTAEVTFSSNSINTPICSTTAVELLYFKADKLNGHQVRLGWATALEVDNFGFNLYRADTNDLGQAELIHFEPAVTQGSGTGATYAYTDTAPYAGTWWYWLSDVDTQGHETFHNAPVHASVMLYRVFFPLIAGD